MDIIKLGKYELFEELGRGGFGTVYHARDSVLEVERAVKVLHPALTADHAFIERFTREAKYAARLKHPHLVPVYDLGESEGRFYLAMEYLPGGSLKDVLEKEGALSFERAMQIIRQVAGALDHIHAHDLIHRDVKPGNILFENPARAVLSDLGFAKALSGTASASLSASGGMIGTPAYMAPELWRGKPPASPATDVYALACMLFEMLSGRVLFAGDSPPEVMTAHVLDGPQFPTAWPSGVPAGLQAVLEKALAKDPTGRFAQVGFFLAALEDLLPAAAQPAAAAIHVPDRGAERNGAVLEQPKEQPASPAPDLAPEMPEQARSPQAQRAEAGTDHPAPGPARKPRLAWLVWGAGTGGVLLLAAFIVAVVFILPRLGISPAAHTQTVATQVRPADGMVMVYVPEGEFNMGSNDGSSAEQPVHSVYLDGYWIDRTEVTNAMYELCVQAGVCAPPVDSSSYTRTSYYGNSQYDDHPVIYVYWIDALVYCDWAEARMPSEAEWEKAARGGLEGALYPWGNNDPTCDLANFGGTSGCVGDTAEVGSYPANGYGLYDMAGNVWEWVNDWYDVYPGGDAGASNYFGTEARVLRGGAWDRNEDSLRSANRDGYGPASSSYFIGFRCSRSLP